MVNKWSYYFLLGWLPLTLGGDKFKATVLSYNLPRITRIIMIFAMIGVVSSAYFSINLLPPSENLRETQLGLMILQWFLLPLTNNFRRFSGNRSANTVNVWEIYGILDD